jgi:hypothetical protein
MFEGPEQTHVLVLVLRFLCSNATAKQDFFLAKDKTQKVSVQRMACLLFSHFVEKRTSIKVFSWQIHTAKILL